MLKLIGLGLWNYKDMTFRGLEEAKDCDIIYLEAYTSKMLGSSKQDYEQMLEKSIQLADRDFIETGKILDYAVKNKVALLIGGDPLVATTHSDLLLQAKERGVRTVIVHNASIYSAIAEAGLQIYKFGKAVTISFWTENYKPTSFIDVYKENKERGLHTLFFLDINMEENKFMSAAEGFEILLKSGFDANEKLIVCSQLGSDNSRISYGTIDELKNKDIGIPLQVIIVPGKLHEKELEFLGLFR